MKMCLISSCPLRRAVLMSPDDTCAKPHHCMIKASDAADKWDCHGALLSDLDLESPTDTDVLLPFQSTSMSGPTSRA